MVNWCKFNRLYVNWTKTFAMFVTNKHDVLPNKITVGNNLIDVVEEFKLLGVTVDNKLNFKKHIDNVVKLINKRLYAISKIFYLSFDVKLLFFKSFILPFFDYCNTLIIYYNSAAIKKLCKCYYFCLLKLFKIDLNDHDCFQINNLLSKYKLFSFQHRIVFRLTVFLFKIKYSQTRPNILNSWIQHTFLDNQNYNLRSNNTIIFLADRTCLKYGD